MKFRLIEEKENKKCVICGEEIKGYGNNAEPVKKGQCCDKCNKEVVIPARLKGMKKSLDLDEALGLKENVDIKDLESEVTDWALEDYENGAILDIDDVNEFKHILLDNHPELKNYSDLDNLIDNLNTLYFNTVNMAEEDDYRGESLKEDTVKQNGKWVNKGKEGTHGTFKTKKEADAQRKAMFARGFKESLKESKYDTYESDDEIIVYDISGQEIERFLEIEEFDNYTDNEIIYELRDRFGDDVVIKRVSYDDENLPLEYETLYEKDYMFEESLQKDELSDFFDKAKRLGVTTVKELKDLLAQEESKGNTEKEKIDAYADSVELGNDTLSNESLKEDLNKESLEQEIRKAIREHFKTWDDEDYEDMIGEYLVVEVEDQEDGRTKVEVRAELTYNTMDKIADELNKIVQKYDKDAYFDHEDAGIINAFIDKNAEGKVIDEYDASKDEKLQGVRLRDYRNKWSAIDHMEVNGVDYYMFENDTYGDETYYVVTPNINDGPFYETFDDIETCLRDEGVLGLNEKLIQGKSDATLKKNIATEVKAGKDPKQAYAIAKSVQKKNMKESFEDEFDIIDFIRNNEAINKIFKNTGLSVGNIDPEVYQNKIKCYYDGKDLGEYFTGYHLQELVDDPELKELGIIDADFTRNGRGIELVFKDILSESLQKKNESFEDEHLGEVTKNEQLKQEINQEEIDVDKVIDLKDKIEDCEDPEEKKKLEEDSEIVDYFDNSVHDEDIMEDDFDEKHIEELTKKAIEESKKHTKEVGTTINENKTEVTPTQEVINEALENNEEEVAIDYVSPNAVDANFQAQEVDLNNI